MSALSRGTARPSRAVILAFVVTMVALAACGGESGGGKPRLESAGDAQVEVSDDKGATTTLPVAEDDVPVVQRLGSTFADFRACLDREGWGGLPIPLSQAEFEKIDPAYLDALSKCNNETGMVEVFQEFQAEAENLDPEQLEQRNEALIAFRECAIRRGWEFAKLAPDENGALTPTAAPVAPPGRDTGRDFQECGQEAAAKVGVELGDGGNGGDNQGSG